MPDHLDRRINALVVELLDHPVEPPPFPADGALVTERTSPRAFAGWAVGVAAFIAVAVLGAISYLFITSEPTPVIEPTPNDIISEFAGALNDHDLEALLDLFAGDAQCVVPGLPACADILGFFVAADALVVLSECSVENEPYVQCQGYLHTSIHEALGMTVSELESRPNFPPAFIIEDSRITQFSFMTPFTGDRSIDDSLWMFLQDKGVGYLNEAGIPRFSADIVPALLRDAEEYAGVRGGG